jgi:hypothetical protein
MLMEPINPTFFPMTMQQSSPRKGRNGKRLILDLDETLVHTFAAEDNFPAFYNNLTEDQKKRVYAIEFPTGETLYGYIRPGVEFFLQVAFQEFDSVSVWSAGTEYYVHEIVKLVFKNQMPDFIMTRNDCNELQLIKTEQVCRFKPLEIIYKKYPGYNEMNTLIVDDRRDICKLNCINNIQVPEFMLTINTYLTLLNDTSLETLAKWFQTDLFRQSRDIRTIRSYAPFKI